MKRVIIDCDPGMDDAMALLLAAASPELDVELVTAVAGNRDVSITAVNARRVLDYAGLNETPVLAGAARSFSHAAPRTNVVHGEDGLGGADFGAARPITAGFAPDRIAALLQDDNPMSLVAIGPLTNLALAELRSPGCLARAEHILLMGGAAFSHGNATPAAEFNIYADPIAANIVFTSGAKIVMFGLDVTREARVTADFRKRLQSGGTRTGELMETMLAFYFRDEFLLHDPCPIAWLIDPTLFESLHAHTSIDTYPGPGQGRTLVWHDVVEPAPGPVNTEVVTGIDPAGLLTLMLRIEALG